MLRRGFGKRLRLLCMASAWLLARPAPVSAAGEPTPGERSPQERRRRFLEALPAWRIERREQVREWMLAQPGRDRWKWPALIDSDDPEWVARANAGLRDARDRYRIASFVLAEKRYADRLEQATRETIRAKIRTVLDNPQDQIYQWPSWLRHPEKVQRPFGSTYYDTAMTGVLCGEVLGDPELLEAGRALLRKLVTTRNLDGEEGQFNSPNYTTFGMTSLAILAENADDRECRSLARWLFARRLLMQLSRYHPASNQVGCPYSRGYAPDQFGTGNINLALHDLVVADGVAHDIDLARRYDGGYTALRHSWWLSAWEVPDYVHRLATDKPYPYEVLSTSWDVGWNWRRSDGTRRVFPAGQRMHTTYLTRSYVLGSSHDLYLYQPSGNPFLAQWPVREPVAELADVRVLWSWYARDDQGAFENVLVLRRGGIFRTLQHRNRVLAVFQPRDQPEPLATDALKLVFMLTASRPLEELHVGNRRVDPGELPVEFAEVEPVFLADGAVYAAVLPLEVSDLGRSCGMRLHVDEHGFLQAAFYNYRGAQREFAWQELPSIRNGFAFEIAERGAYGDLDAFRDHMRLAHVRDTMAEQERLAVFQSGGDTLELRYNPFRDEVLERRVNGEDVAYRWFRSPNAVLSADARVTVERGTLANGSGVALWLLKDPAAETYAVWNLSGETVSLNLSTPVGRVSAEGFGMGRLVLRDAPQPMLEVEELPGARAVIRVEGPDGPLPVVRPEA